MVDRIIGFSVSNKLVIGLFTLVLILTGLYELTRLPIDAVPDITNNQVQIISPAPSLGAADMERLVTFPVEQGCRNISGINEIRSFSRSGLSVVTIVFDDDIDVYWARQQVAERLQLVQNEIGADVAVPQMGPVTSGLGEIYQYVVRPAPGYESRYGPEELRTIQDWIIRRQLLGVEGVAEVSSFGGKVKQYEVAVDPARLHAMGVTIGEIVQSLERNNQNGGGAYIERGPEVLFIRSEGLLKSVDDIRSITVRTTENGVPVRVADVAAVRIGNAIRYGALCYNDQGEVSGAVVMMLKGANSSDVIKRVKERVDLIRGTLPEGVILEPFLDRSKMVNSAISTVTTNLAEGALIVIFILVLFLGNLRAGFIVASVIPLSMLFAIIMMNVFGVSGNLMSLGALDFGLIVDGAVIIVEAVMHRFAAAGISGRLSATERSSEVRNAASRMMSSAVFGQVIILVVYLPVFALRGIEGKMFIPMAQTVTFALVGAFILSVTYVPMMSALMLGRSVRTADFSLRWMRKVETVYRRLLALSFRHSKAVIGFVLLLFMTSAFVMTTLGGEFIPALEEGDFAIDTRVLTGSNLGTTIEYTQKAAHRLITGFPEVEKVVTKIGSGEVATDPMPLEVADMMVILKPKDDWVSARTFPELAAKMSDTLKGVPGITAGFQYPVQMRFNELMTGARQDVVCKIFGENLDTLSILASRMAAIAAKVEGAEDIFVESVTGVRQIIVSLEREAMSQNKVDAHQVNLAISAAFAGAAAGKIYEGERRFDLVVRMDAGLRSDVSHIARLLVSTHDGRQVPLAQVASVQIVAGPNQIQREDARRRIVMGFNVRGRDVETVVEEMKQAAGALNMPAGYSVTYGGAFENLQHATKRLAVAVPISLALIFILLFIAFRNLKHSLLIYSAIPLSATGGIFFLALRGMPFSISAGVGFIALFGVAVLNGIVLISEFNRLRRNGLDTIQIVFDGAVSRLRPVLMTALVASLGFLPMALSNSAGAEVQRPLATVVIGGLLLSTLLTLFVLPILYKTFSDRKFKPGAHSLLIAGFLFGCGSAAAQQTPQPISLQAAIDSAVKNNIDLKRERLAVRYRDQLNGTALEIPGTSVAAEYGQLNSAFTDNRVVLSQTFRLPPEYSARRKLLAAQWESSKAAASLSQAELARDVSQVYFSIVSLRLRLGLLHETDSLFNELKALSGLRERTGAAGSMEGLSLVGESVLIRSQRRNVQAEIHAQMALFTALLNTVLLYEPDNNLSKVALTGELVMGEHPRIILYQSEIKVAEAARRQHKTQILPDLSFGYINQSLTGMGADDIYYSRTKRFQAVQVGLTIPLFFGSSRARVSAAATAHEMAVLSFQSAAARFKIEFDKAVIAYRTGKTTLEEFDNAALPAARQLRVAANQRLSLGDISFMEWFVYIKQSLQVENEYLDALDRHNEAATRLNYLLAK